MTFVKASAAYARIVGPLLFFVFGSISLVLSFRLYELRILREEIEKKGQDIFVQITLAQDRETPFGKRYFYTYRGEIRAVKFARTEEVDAGLFRSHSEGKNLEARAFMDATGNTHARLRADTILPGKPMEAIRLLSLFFAGCGVFLFVGTWIYNRMKKDAGQ